MKIIYVVYIITISYSCFLRSDNTNVWLIRGFNEMKTYNYHTVRTVLKIE
jgi:hypothetical protein